MTIIRNIPDATPQELANLAAREHQHGFGRRGVREFPNVDWKRGQMGAIDEQYMANFRETVRRVKAYKFFGGTLGAAVGFFASRKYRFLSGAAGAIGGYFAGNYLANERGIAISASQRGTP